MIEAQATQMTTKASREARQVLRSQR
jgi:hypothetical protein